MICIRITWMMLNSELKVYLDLISAFTKIKKKEDMENLGEKLIIIISSFLSWAGNEHKMVPEKPQEEDPNMDMMGSNMDMAGMEPGAMEEKEEDYTEEKRLEDDKILEEVFPEQDDLSDSQNEAILAKKALQKKIIEKRLRWEEIKKKNEVKLIRAPYEEEEYAKRIPSKAWEKEKELEDWILSIKNEKLKFYIISAGALYGYAETVFNYHFKHSWLQSDEQLPYIGEGNNFVPTIHVKDLCKIVKMVIDKKPENPFVIAVDQTKDKQQKKLVSSISVNVGTGKTCSIDDETVEEINYYDEFEDLFINPELIEKKKLDLILTPKQFIWKDYFRPDVWLKGTKVVEEEYEWSSKVITLI